MPIGTPHGTLDYKQVSKVTFVGASSNTVIDTTTGSLGVGVDSSGPTSNLHVVGNAYVSSNLTVGEDLTVSGNATFSGTGALTLPSGTTEEQPSTGLVGGMIRYNSTTTRPEVYNGSVWVSIGGITATGGTISTSGAYKIHTFTGGDTGGDTFTVIGGGGQVEYLVVAGGGGGGTGESGYSHEAGGGGAGGLIQGNIATLSAGNYLVVVGGGGGPATKGTNSSINFPTLITAEGGGQGGSGDIHGITNGGNGGSGGGGRHSTAGGSGTAGQGNNGGGGANFLGTSLTYGNSGGGGGGAGQVGGANGPTDGGNGIEFIYYNHKGSPAGWFAGGGRGVVISSGYSHPAWTSYGGGGIPNPVIDSGAPTNGVINTGGGGGGAFRQFGSVTGGSGGSGIVIIRYLL